MPLQATRQGYFKLGRGRHTPKSKTPTSEGRGYAWGRVSVWLGLGSGLGGLGRLCKPIIKDIPDNFHDAVLGSTGGTVRLD